MRRTKHNAGRMVAAFALGILLSVVLPSDVMLIVTVIVLILLAVICSTNLIRG